ncbi:hypothetical protein HDV00_002487 [Rhizophlyctis rosea]|nr:hypothetical protein HDV00_002487 [Rhizophlyctis rosea]
MSLELPSTNVGASRTLPRNLGSKHSKNHRNEPLKGGEGSGVQHQGLNKNSSLQRSMSEVLRRRKSRSESAVSPAPTNGEQRTFQSATPVTIPRRTDSKDPLVHKTYGELSQDDLHALHTAALSRVNGIFKHCRIKPAPQDLPKSIQTAVYGQKRKWWAAWKKDKEDGGATVMKTSLVKSLQYASVPADPTDNMLNSRRIPVVVYECIRYLKQHGLEASGLFRVSGSEKRMGHLAVEFDTPPTYGSGCSFEGYSVYDVADFLKKYLRRMPEPLLTFELYPHLLKCLDVPAESGLRIRALRLLLLLLPSPHLVLLETLLDLFASIVTNSHQNQMNSHNLARVFSPNILRSKSQKQPLEEYERCSFVMEILIDNWSQFVVTSKEVRPYHLLDVTYIPRELFGRREVEEAETVVHMSSVHRVGEEDASTPNVAMVIEEPQVRRSSSVKERPAPPRAEKIVRVYSANMPSRQTADSPIIIRRVRTAPTKRSRPNGGDTPSRA